MTVDKAYDQSCVYEDSNNHMNESGQINIQEQLLLFQLRMKPHLDNEINITCPSTKTVPQPEKEHQAITVNVTLKTCSFDPQKLLVMNSKREVKPLDRWSLFSLVTS